MTPKFPIKARGNGTVTDAGVISAPPGLITRTGLNLSGMYNSVVLASDVANANATPNTMQDVTGLSFAVEAGKMYQFEFIIMFSAAATTTGSRWAINGPTSPTYICYSSEYSLTSTTSTRNANVIAYDSPAGASATSGDTASNLAYILGMIQPSAAGTVIARFASEITVSAITARAGSMLNWRKLT